MRHSRDRHRQRVPALADSWHWRPRADRLALHPARHPHRRETAKSGPGAGGGGGAVGVCRDCTPVPRRIPGLRGRAAVEVIGPRSPLSVAICTTRPWNIRYMLSAAASLSAGDELLVVLDVADADCADLADELGRRGARLLRNGSNRGLS